MGIQDKIANAKETDWLTKGMPKWKVTFNVRYARFKIKFWRLFHKVK